MGDITTGRGAAPRLHPINTETAVKLGAEHELHGKTGSIGGVGFEGGGSIVDRTVCRHDEPSRAQGPRLSPRTSGEKSAEHMAANHSRDQGVEPDKGR